MAIQEYLTDYMTKDGVELSTSLSLFHDAATHIKNYPSTAADTGTVGRTAQHFLQRVLNSLSGQSEISATQAASSLLGMSSQSFSAKFSYLYIKPAVDFVLANTDMLPGMLYFVCYGDLLIHFVR